MTIRELRSRLTTLFPTISALLMRFKILTKDPVTKKKYVAEWLNQRCLASAEGLVILGRINSVSYNQQDDTFMIISTLKDTTAKSIINAKTTELIRRDIAYDIIGPNSRCVVNGQFIYIEQGQYVVIHRVEDFSFVERKKWMFVSDDVIVDIRGNTVVGFEKLITWTMAFDKIVKFQSIKAKLSDESLTKSFRMHLGSCHDKDIVCFYGIDHHIFKTYRIIAYKIPQHELGCISLFKGLFYTENPNGGSNESGFRTTPV